MQEISPEMLINSLVMIGIIGVYAFLWNRKRIAAVFILIGLSGYLANQIIDWRWVEANMFMSWGSGPIGFNNK